MTVDFDGPIPASISRCSSCGEITLGVCRQCEQAVCFDCTEARNHVCLAAPAPRELADPVHHRDVFSRIEASEG